MKVLLALFFVLSFNFVNAQTKINEHPFSTFTFGAYGGINFVNTSDIGGNMLFEIKANLISNLNMQLSAGYDRSIEPINKNVKTYSSIPLDSVPRYYASSYNILRKNYDVFPISVGLQYVMKSKNITPYLMANFNYNIVEVKSDISSIGTWSYRTFEEIPSEFRTKFVETYPNNYYGFAVGIGAGYNLSKSVNLDLRYLYKINNETINTHNLLFGIYF